MADNNVISLNGEEINDLDKELRLTIEYTCGNSESINCKSFGSSQECPGFAVILQSFEDLPLKMINLASIKSIHAEEVDTSNTVTELENL